MAQTVFIVAATHGELSLLIRTGNAKRLPSVVPPEVYEGMIGTTRILYAVTGIGKVNAASATAALLERSLPALLINTGCAGAYHGCGLAVGDLAIASHEIFGDEGVKTPKGWESLRLIGIPVLERSGMRLYNEFPLSGQATERAAALAGSLGNAATVGRFVTVSTCSGTRKRGDEMARRFGAVAENMEGGAVAQVAMAYGVECIEVRGISNMVEDRDLATWDIPLAVERVQEFVVKFIETL